MLVALAVAATMAGYSDTVYNAVNNLDWNDATEWGGSAPTAGNDYVVNTGAYPSMRIGASGASSTFGGDNLILTGGSDSLIKANGGTTSTVTGNLTFDGATLRNGPNTAGDNTLAATQFIIGAGGGTLTSSRTMGIWTLDGTLTGSGDLGLSIYNPSGGDGVVISITGISGYTGAITVTSDVDLEFGTDYTFTGGLDITDASSQLVVNNGQTLTFAEGTLVDSVNGTVAAGSYSGAALDGLGSDYINNGGTVVVIPEPGTLGLVGMMGGCLLLIRRFIVM